MSITQRQIQIAAGILGAYDGTLPFHLFLSNYFKKQRNFGSRDRRNYRNYCYAYWRLGDLVKPGTSPYELLTRIVNETPETTFVPELSKVETLLSPKVNYDDYCTLFSKQAQTNAVVIKKETARAEIKSRGLNFTEDRYNFTFEANTSLEWIMREGLGWIMDKGSARVIEEIGDLRNKHVWDTCSGAGGKSLWLTAFNKPKTLLCTDIRPGILENLRQRFAQMDFHVPELQVLDLAKHSLNANSEFEVIVCDVPCSGSGTWRRTPESYAFFDPAHLKKYPPLQLSILNNAAKRLLPGGQLYYMTCSAFEDENEKVIERFLEKNTGFELTKSLYTTSTAMDSDILYCAALYRY